MKTQIDEQLICTLFAQGVSLRNISKQSGVPKSTLSFYFRNPTNTSTITKWFQKYVSDPTAVKIAHKRIRLDDLEQERLSIKATMQLYKSADGTILDKKVNKYLSLMKRFLEIELLGRDEVEKKEIPWKERSPLDEVGNDEIVRELADIDKRLIASRSISQEKGCTAAGVVVPA